MNIKFISVDLQKDFSAKGGTHYRVRPAVSFIKNVLLPYLEKRKIKVSEIVSDYRREYGRKDNDACIPGTWGYASEMPVKNKNSNVWIKCQNSPIWITKNIGDPMKRPGMPYQDPKAFSRWLNDAVGKPEDVDLVVLVGLTLDSLLGFIPSQLAASSGHPGIFQSCEKYPGSIQYSHLDSGSRAGMTPLG
ncbi:MAG: hypothetical protein HY978_00775 [Candidatus Liptonbacteria bacterium]|nr:hypothetical protein [Candidatus Liptonbacteria bacterium]